MAVVHLIRHARSTGNHDNRLTGNAPDPLTPTGIVQAHHLADRLREERIDVLHSSPLVRAVQTAEILTAAGLPGAVIDDGLTERDFGDFEGLTRPDLLAARERHGLDPADPTGWFPDGVGGVEPHQKVAARVDSVVRDLAVGDRRVALLTHAGAIKCFLYEALGIPERTPRAVKIFQAGFVTLRVAPAGHLTLHELWRNPLR